MKATISVLLAINALCLFFVGTNGDPIQEVMKSWSNNEILTLKSLKQMFTRPRVLGSLVKDDFSRAAVADDPHCPPGFKRGPRGLCREVW